MVVEQQVQTADARAIVNSTKDKMAQAFLISLNSTVNYALDGMGRDHDGLGIDYIASNATIGLGRKATTPASMVNIQLKGTGIDSPTKVELTERFVRYHLDKKLVAIGRHYLFVVVLPKKEEIDKWCVVEPERIILNAKGYYFQVNGTLSSGWVNIPISNKLTPSNYKSLFLEPLQVEFTI